MTFTEKLLVAAVAGAMLGSGCAATTSQAAPKMGSDKHGCKGKGACKGQASGGGDKGNLAEEGEASGETSADAASDKNSCGKNSCS